MEVKMKPIVDISYWQQGIDYDKFAAGISGAILRGAYGIWPDTMFETHYKELHDRGVPLGSYHYIIGNKTGLEQADVFNQVIANKELKLGLWDDVEDRRDTTALNANTVIEYHGNIETITKRKVCIYTGQYAWYEIMGKESNRFGDRDLWMSWPTVSQPPMPIGSSWTKWLLWQYTFKGRIDGYSSDVDCNNFNGSEEEYKQHFGIGTITPPTPEPPANEITLPKLKVLRFVYIRPEPRTNIKETGNYNAGDIIDVLEIKPINQLSVWVRTDKGWSAVVHYGVRYME